MMNNSTTPPAAAAAPGVDLEQLSKFHQKMLRGEFVVTAELVPPKSPRLDKIKKKCQHFRRGVDAVNVTDLASAMLRMSSMAASIVIVQEGLEPVMQMTCRDRNRLYLQADLLAAYAFGIRNVLCLTGDYIHLGDAPTAKPVFDLDSTNLIMTLNQMRTKGLFYSGGEIRDLKKEEPHRMQWCIGGAANPAGNKATHLAAHMKKKAQAGVDFLQTQPVFDLDAFDGWWREMENQGVTERVAILPGILPPKSARGFRFMKEEVPGMVIPEEYVKRMEQAEDQQETGLAIALEIMQALREKYAIHGFHIYPVYWEAIVPTLLEKAGRLAPAEPNGAG